ncbi:MAG: hypothetical protein KHX45_24775 [Clostridiales bacterium]|nr:hypothetical protein [Clostridiales bacterium]
MDYPKEIMRLSELQEIGFPKQYLLNAYRYPGQKFATKMDANKGNSPIIFDIKGFEKWRQTQIKIQQRR